MAVGEAQVVLHSERCGAQGAGVLSRRDVPKSTGNYSRCNVCARAIAWVRLFTPSLL